MSEVPSTLATQIHLRTDNDAICKTRVVRGERLGLVRTRGPSKKSYARAKRAYEIIKDAGENGINTYLLAHTLELPRANNGAICSILISCARHGMLVSEDEKGQLYAFEERGLYATREWDGWR